MNMLYRAASSIHPVFDGNTCFIICSDKDNSDSDYNKGGGDFLRRMFPKMNRKIQKGRFPENMSQVPNYSLVCFMGCNQIHHVFTKKFVVHEFTMDILSTLEDEVLTSLRTLENKWFFFLEKIEALEPTFRVHTFETMSKLNLSSKYAFAQNAQFLIAKTVEIIKANVTTFEKDGMIFYTPNIGERRTRKLNVLL